MLKRLNRAANLVEQYLKPSLGSAVEVDMRARVKLNDKMDGLFNDNAQKIYLEMVKKRLFSPDVSVIVIGKSELEVIFP